MCFFRLHFCLVRLGQNGHWNWGSLPHSSRWCLTNDVFHRYFLPHALHLNPSTLGTSWQYLGTLLCVDCHWWHVSGLKDVPVRRPNNISKERGCAETTDVYFIVICNPFLLLKLLWYLVREGSKNYVMQMIIK